MTTEAQVGGRSPFGRLWAQAILDMVRHSGDAADGGPESPGRLLRAAWDPAELERAEAERIGALDLLMARLLAHMSPDLAAIRTAALEFAAKPGDRTRSTLLETLRERLPGWRHDRFAMAASPFDCDGPDAEVVAWIRRQLAAG